MLEIKQFILWILHSAIDLLLVIQSCFDKSPQFLQQTMLIVRMDGIGDYVLFRNYLECLKNSEKYKSYDLTLVGNIAWKDLAEELDRPYISEFIWINRNRFNSRQLKYRYCILKKLRAKKYDIVINPRFSREFYFDDQIVKNIKANEKVAFCQSNLNSKPWQSRISNKWYTKKIQYTPYVIFEFYRNKEFFEAILDEHIDLNKPRIHLDDSKPEITLPDGFVVLNFKSSDAQRKIPLKKWAHYAHHISRKHALAIVLTGGTNEAPDSIEFENLYAGKLYNYVGKTTLCELAKIFMKSKLLISPDTSAPHIATAIGGCKILLLYAEKNLGRFVPYPDEIQTYDYHVVYHPKIAVDLDFYKKISNLKDYKSSFDMKEFEDDLILDKIDRLLLKV